MDAVREATHPHGEMHVSRMTDDTILVRLSGSWTLQSDRPTVAELWQQLDAEARVQRVTFETQDLEAWDSGLLTFLRRLEDLCQQGQIAVDRAGLPDGIRRFLDLAAAVPERQGARRGEARDAALARIGKAGIGVVEGATAMLGVIGEAFLALLLQECGAQALPIVTLISFLVAAILAFIGDGLGSRYPLLR